ncbi:hypothetical protein CCO03_12290 [Comamonas serinivorans]|uniref:Uncharacterized protein n=1 Tax=Comamonas serinivorans TaxID=1082851 RepID=A0A1Y0EPM7_9BURK|nr:DUF6348 family protein [Comamonas serinivorans]ARU05361.1 hypothetical protein CCO03_12290 [Comamonas serinivorans]
MSNDPVPPPEAPAQPDANPAQAALTALLAAHGLPVEDYNGWLLPHGQPPGLSARWTPASNGHALIGVLSVVLRMADRREIVENFAGLGEGEAGLRDALASFAEGGLHAMLAAIWNLRGEALPEPERWTVKGQTYEVFSGPWQLRNNAPLPGDIEAHLRAWIEHEPLDQALHWFRFFVSQHEGSLGIEALKDNALWEPGKHLAELDWASSDAFYSARRFMLLRRVDEV